MPVWSGLDLLREMKEDYPHISSFVLSGYDDYNLVREALRSGATDYLLKPVDIKAFIHTVRTTIKSLELNQYQPPSADTVHLDSQIILEQLLLHSTDNCEITTAFLEKHRINDSSHCLLCYIDIMNSLYSEKMTIRSFLADQAYACFHSAQTDLIADFIFGEIDNFWVLLIFSPSDHDITPEILEPFLVSVRQQGLRVVCQQQSYPLSRISFAKAECIRGFEKYYYDLCTTSIVSETPENDAHNALTKAIDFLSEYNFSQGAEQISIAFSIYNTYCPSIPHVKRVLTNFVYNLISKNSEYIKVISESRFTEFDLLEQIEENPSFSGLKTHFINSFNHYIKTILKNIANKDDYIIKQAKNYIHANYNDQLCLADVAAHVYLNPSYFSSVFKSRTGINFRHYLRNYRIQKAKELLQNTPLKIYQIAELTGYQESAHFVRAFKEVEGISPSEFRQRC